MSLRPSTRWFTTRKKRRITTTGRKIFSYSKSHHHCQGQKYTTHTQPRTPIKHFKNFFLCRTIAIDPSSTTTPFSFQDRHHRKKDFNSRESHHHLSLIQPRSNFNLKNDSSNSTYCCVSNGWHSCSCHHDPNWEERRAPTTIPPRKYVPIAIS